jgi:hypothetical protein
MKSMSKPARKKELGQALVETAITMPILILILSGLLDLGRVYYTYIALEEAGAESARFLAISPTCPGDEDPDPLEAGNPCADPNNARYRAEHAGNQEFDLSRTSWNIPYSTADHAVFDDPFAQCAGAVSIGCIVEVQITYNYDFITPGIEAIANGISGGNGLILRVESTEIVVYEQ